MTQYCLLTLVVVSGVGHYRKEIPGIECVVNESEFSPLIRCKIFFQNPKSSNVVRITEYRYGVGVCTLMNVMFFQVTSIENRKSAQILREVSKFAAREDHGQMVALIIMSHGDERGNIRGTDRSTVPLSVQSVIDVLCVDHLKDKPKVAIASYI